MGLRYIVDTELGWDHAPYYDYLAKISSQMPESLRRYALDKGSYARRGSTTIHDTRLIGLTLAKEYGQNLGDVETTASLEVINQDFDMVLRFEYGGVGAAVFKDGAPLPGRASDLLLHEFTLRGDGNFGHYILGDFGLEIDIKFRQFSFTLVPLDEAASDSVLVFRKGGASWND